MSDERPSKPAASGNLPSHLFTATGLAASLTANDLAASVTWYRDVIGFAVEREYERDGVRFAARLRAGEVAILVTQDNGARGADRVKGEGCSLQLTTSQDVDELAARIKACGVTLDTEPADAQGARVFRLRDPDGFRLVFSSQR